MSGDKIRADSIWRSQPFVVILKSQNFNRITISKSTNFFGQPVYGQLIKSLDREKILKMSRENGGERNVKSFDGYTHLLTVFRKDGINHIARVITYVDIKKGKKPKLISLLANDFDMSPRTIVAIYRTGGRLSRCSNR